MFRKLKWEIGSVSTMALLSLYSLPSLCCNRCPDDRPATGKPQMFNAALHFPEWAASTATSHGDLSA